MPLVKGIAEKKLGMSTDRRTDTDCRLQCIDGKTEAKSRESEQPALALSQDIRGPHLHNP